MNQGTLVLPLTINDMLALTAIVLTLAVAMITFLNRTNRSNSNNVVNGGDQKKERGSKVKEKLGTYNGQNHVLSVEEKSKIINLLSEKIHGESVESVLKDLEMRIETTIVDQFLNEKINKSINRLENEKDSLFKRGNFNLVIGVLISGLGGFLAYYFIQKLPVVGTTIELLSYSFPRVSLFILIALLVFFFLNLYKKV